MILNLEDADRETDGTDFHKPYLRPGDTVLVRPLTRTGYELVVSLDRPLRRETLLRLAFEMDRAHLIEQGLSLVPPDKLHP